MKLGNPKRAIRSSLCIVVLAIHLVHSAVVVRDPSSSSASQSSGTSASNPALPTSCVDGSCGDFSTRLVDRNNVGNSSKVTGTDTVPWTCGNVTLADLSLYGDEIEDYVSNWLGEVLKDPARTADLKSQDDILKYFGLVHWNDGSFTCDIENGCRHGAHCDTILWYELQKPRAGRTDAEIQKRGNIIYLAFLKMVTINDILKSLWTALQFTRNTAETVTTKLMSNFDQPHEIAVAAHCGMMSGENVVSAIFGALLGIPNEKVQDEKFIRLMESEDWLSRAPTNDTLSFPEVLGACEAENRVQSEIFRSVEEMKGHVNQWYQNQRDLISNWWTTSISTQSDNPGRDLLDLMETITSDAHDWSNQLRLNVDQEYIDEKMTPYLISAAWVAGKFYLKCQIGGYLDAKTCESKYPETYRYCPPNPDPSGQRITCQPEGYTMMTHPRNHEIPLMGSIQLQAWGFDPRKVFSDAFDYYLQFGNVPRPDPLTIGASPNFELSSMLPVCNSRHAIVWDHERSKEKKNGNFPCHCGSNWWGSETQSFMNRLGIGIKSPAYINGDPVWDILVNTCYQPLEKLPPVTKFIAKCHLGVQEFTLPNDIYSYWKTIRLSKDPSCDQVIKALAERGWNEQQANQEVCEWHLDEATKTMWSADDGMRTKLFHDCWLYRDFDYHNSSWWKNYNWDVQPFTTERLNEMGSR